MLIDNELTIILRYSSIFNTCNGGTMTRKTISIVEAAAALGIGRSAAYEAARCGQIPTIRIGRRILVPVAAFERFLDHPEGLPRTDIPDTSPVGDQ